MFKIGVTGHRELKKEDIETYKLKVFQQLNILKQKYNKLILYSALADGADRLVIYEAQKLNIKFIAILPFTKELYKNDFDLNSKIEFDDLLTNSDNIIQIPHKSIFSKRVQYELAGHYISDNSDILFALWDKKYNRLQGGTSEIVKYHLKNKKKLWHLKVLRNSF